MRRLWQPLNGLDEHCYVLKHRMTNLRLLERDEPHAQRLGSVLAPGWHAIQRSATSFVAAP